MTSAPVAGIDVVAGRVRQVATAAGTVETPTVVIAAGPWSAQLGAMAGVELPIEPVRRQIAVTSPIAGLRPDFPFVIDFSRALYFHREGVGILTGMSNRDEPPGFACGLAVAEPSEGLGRGEPVCASSQRSRASTQVVPLW